MIYWWDSCFIGFTYKLKVKSEKRKMYNEDLIRQYMQKYNWSRDKVIEESKKQNFTAIYSNFPILQPQLNIFFSKNNEWITWTNEGYFNASPKGMEYIYFHLNQGSNKEAKAISLKKLYDHFFRPDLIQMKIEGKDISKYTKNITYKTALQNPPPIVKIKNSTIKQDKATLNFNIKDEKGGVGKIRIYQEGKLIFEFGKGAIKKVVANVNIIEEQNRIEKEILVANASEVQKAFKNKTKNAPIKLENQIGKVKIETKENQAGEYQITLDLKAGENRIEIEAFNKTNTVSSFREAITLKANIPKVKPTLFLIVAGVNHFKANYVSNLNYSVNDAKAIAKALQKVKGYNEVKVISLLDSNFTTQNLQNEITKIQKEAKLEDTLIFYASTHGVSGEGELALIPHNNENEKNFIYFKNLFASLQKVKALNQIFIIDSCESGTASDIVSKVYDARASILAKSAGVHLLLATTRGTKAFEHQNKNIKNSLFTHNILRALKDKESDLDKNGVISVKELSKRLKEYKSNEFQYPIIRNVGRDVELVDVSEK